MHSNIRLVLLASALAFASISGAQAPLNPPAAASDAPKIDFATVDTDANGQVSRTEARVIPELDGAFDALDKNRDQTVSPTEFSLWTLAGKAAARPRDPATAPGGSAGAQHVPDTD